MANEYRITIKSLYPEGCVGHTKPSARQGHYYNGMTIFDAGLRAWSDIHKTSPNVKPEDLEIELWNENVFVPTYVKSVK